MSNVVEHQPSAPLFAAGRTRPTLLMMQRGDITLTGMAAAARVLTQAAVGEPWRAPARALRGGRS